MIKSCVFGNAPKVTVNGVRLFSKPFIAMRSGVPSACCACAPGDASSGARTTRQANSPRRRMVGPHSLFRPHAAAAYVALVTA
jgi:hypothetical protein